MTLLKYCSNVSFLLLMLLENTLRIAFFFAVLLTQVNERSVVNEIYVPNFLYPLITCTCLVFFYQKNITVRKQKRQTSSVLTL